VYLGAAVLFAVLDTMFIICRYDPFVAVFRLGGGFGMLIVGGIVLLAAMFIGRPYCRFACPYRVLLGLCSRLAWRHATITPDQCVVCSLCEGECPFGAIRRPTPEGAVGEE
jgi:polyferredoxin